MDRSDLRNALYEEFKLQRSNPGTDLPTARQIDDLAQLLLAEQVELGDVAIMATVLGWNSAQFWAWKNKR